VTTVDGPDSVAVDAAGNLFVTTMREGVAVFAADGTRWARSMYRTRANCAFGDPDARTPVHHS
jgi:sugar lactone lactonase YvrE